MGFVVQQNTIRQFIKLIDPHGMEFRRAQHPRHRQYNTKGPNGLWHMDAFDKLNSYGMGMLVWMEAHMKNNNLNVVVHYYIKSITHFGGCHKRMCADHGTENSLENST